MIKGSNKDSNNLNPLFKTYAADFAYCERIIKEKSKSFYAAFSQLPREKALSVYAIYAFCREADDSIDVYKDLSRLLSLKENLKQFEKGNIPNHPIWRALSVVFQLYSVEITPYYEMIAGQEKDSRFHQPHTQEELEDYCYYVAGTVALMLLPILARKHAVIKEQALALGTAMQLTNILRDIGEDFSEKRIYLPKEVMETYNYSLNDLETSEINSRFKQVWEYEASRAEELYLFSLKMFPYIDEDCQEPLFLSLIYYREILSIIRKNNYQVFAKRNYVHASKLLFLHRAAKEQLTAILSSN